jgi:hypothetical protein
MTDEPPRADEVRGYLRRLLLTIAAGVLLMATAAVWAYRTYGQKLDTAAPLPSGTPPMTTDSAAGPP